MKLSSTYDNILDLTKYLEEQKLQYVLAVWSPESKDENIDRVNLYTNFEKNELPKLAQVLKESTIEKEPPPSKKK